MTWHDTERQMTFHGCLSRLTSCLMHSEEGRPRVQVRTKVPFHWLTTFSLVERLRVSKISGVLLALKYGYGNCWPYSLLPHSGVQWAQFQHSCSSWVITDWAVTLMYNALYNANYNILIMPFQPTWIPVWFRLAFCLTFPNLLVFVSQKLAIAKW